MQKDYKHQRSKRRMSRQAMVWAKHCGKCGKLLSESNKSGLCSYHYKIKKMQENNYYKKPCQTKDTSTEEEKNTK